MDRLLYSVVVVEELPSRGRDLRESSTVLYTGYDGDTARRIYMESRAMDALTECRQRWRRRTLLRRYTRPQGDTRPCPP